MNVEELMMVTMATPANVMMVMTVARASIVPAEVDRPF
jgi:hypothetical protein